MVTADGSSGVFFFFFPPNALTDASKTGGATPGNKTMCGSATKSLEWDDDRIYENFETNVGMRNRATNVTVLEIIQNVINTRVFLIRLALAKYSFDSRQR